MADPIYNVYVLDDNFYYYDGDSYQPIPPEDLDPIIMEYERVQELESLRQAGIDPDEYEKQWQEMVADFRAESHEIDLSELEAEVAENTKKAKEEKLRKKQERAQKKQKVAGVNPSLEELRKNIQDFISNMIKPQKDREVIYKKTYDRPNVYAKAPGSTLLTKNKVRHREDKTPEVEIPLVVFYFDRSGSFESNAKYETSWKTRLGFAMIDMFKKFEDAGQIECETYYFADKVLTTEAGVGGGTSNTALGNHIESLAKDGRLLNIVLLTDDDIDLNNFNISVNGAVWVLFADTASLGIASHLHGDYKGKNNTRVYFFDNNYENQV